MAHQHTNLRVAFRFRPQGVWPQRVQSPAFTEERLDSDPAGLSSKYQRDTIRFCNWTLSLCCSRQWRAPDISQHQKDCKGDWHHGKDSLSCAAPDQESGKFPRFTLPKVARRLCGKQLSHLFGHLCRCTGGRLCICKAAHDWNGARKKIQTIPSLCFYCKSQRAAMQSLFSGKGADKSSKQRLRLR